MFQWLAPYPRPAHALASVKSEGHNTKLKSKAKAKPHNCRMGLVDWVGWLYWERLREDEGMDRIRMDTVVPHLSRPPSPLLEARLMPLAQ